MRLRKAKALLHQSRQLSDSSTLLSQNLPGPRRASRLGLWVSGGLDVGVGLQRFDSGSCLFRAWGLDFRVGVVAWRAEFLPQNYPLNPNPTPKRNQGKFQQSQLSTIQLKLNRSQAKL